MKRLLFGLAMIFCLIACQDEKMLDTESQSSAWETFYGVIEQGLTKTYIDDLRNVRWQKGDQVAAFLQNTAAKKYQIEDAADGKTSGNFNLIKGNGLSGGTETGLTAAFYPYSSALELTAVADGHYCLDGIVLPAVQEYDPVRTVSQNVLPMLAASNNADNVLNFRNICGVFQFSLKGDAVLDHMVFRGNNGEIICGKSQIEIVPDGIPSIRMTEVESQKNLFLVFAEGGFKLDPSRETVFRLALPPMMFKKGFEVLIYDKNGQGMSLKKDSASEIKRSIVLNFPAVDYVPGVIEVSPEIPSPIVPPTPENQQPNNVIYYTTINNERIDSFYETESRNRFGAYFLSDTYENGKGVLSFDGDVKYIGEAAFRSIDYSNNLKTISLPSSVTTIELNAFNGCNYLERIWLSENIRVVDPFAFSSTGRLEIEVSPDHAFLSSVGGVLFNKDKSVLLCYAKDAIQPKFKISEGVLELGKGALYDCDHLQSLIFPKSLQKIGELALYSSNDNLRSLFFQSEVPPALMESSLPHFLPGYGPGPDIPFDFRIFVPIQSLDKYRGTRYFHTFRDHIVGFDYDSGKALIGVSKELISVPRSAGTNNVAYFVAHPTLETGKITVSSDQSWIKNFEVTEDRISFFTEENTGNVTRDGVVTIQCPNADPKQIKVRQLVSPSMIITANGVDIPLIKVEGGTFTMGGTSEQGTDVPYDEKPVHQVTLSDYYIAQFEVTRELWRAVMGAYPDSYNDRKPTDAVSVSWNDVVTYFLPRLNAMTRKNFTLPTEAQWEFAARGGNMSQGYKYSGSNNAFDVGVFYEETFEFNDEVGQKVPNELGIYDMSGCVWEFCSDWYGPYSAEAQIDPIGPVSGTDRVVRGGGSNYSYIWSTVSSRNHVTPDASTYNFGFRLALPIL